MPDFLVLRSPATDAPAGTLPVPCGLIVGVDDAQTAALRAYSGEGRFCVVRWDEHEEFDLTAGAPIATPASKK